MDDKLSLILARQAGFQIDELGTVMLGDTTCTIEVELLIQLVAGWCLEKNRRFLFSHQATHDILKDFGYNQDPKPEHMRPL
jgi:hypothetical protein